jgi:chemotaxis protein MotB
MAAEQRAPILLKRKKVVAGGGHHGGAWKVAYADFVTAMMAFFLLMWLLNATTEQQRKGLADYFAPTIPMARVSGGGEDMFGGDSPSSSDSMAHDGGAGAPVPALPRGEDAGEAEEAAETAALLSVEDALLGRGGESLLSDEAMAHVVTRLTDEGLVIEVFSLPGAPLFVPGTDEPLPITADILRAVARLAGLVENRVAVAGFLAARPVMLRDGPGWALSAARADRARELLEGGGVAPARLARVTGHADRSPAVANPVAPRNDRLEVTLLRRGRGI